MGSGRWDQINLIEVPTSLNVTEVFKHAYDNPAANA